MSVEFVGFLLVVLVIFGIFLSVVIGAISSKIQKKYKPEIGIKINNHGYNYNVYVL